MRSSADGSCHSLMVIDSVSRARDMAIKRQPLGTPRYENVRSKLWPVPHHETTRYDRYSLEHYCRHCGTYLNTRVGIERERVPKVQAELRELAQSHANAFGHEVEVTFRVTQERRVWFTPESTA